MNNPITPLVDYPPPTERLSEVTDRFSLPVDYLQFLLKHNGGSPEKNAFEGEEIDGLMGGFYPVCRDGDPIEGRDLLAAIDNFHDSGRIPSEMIPIADAPGGDQVLISIVPSNWGRVYFFIHDAIPGEKSVFYVAESFTAFMEMLVSEDDAFGDDHEEPSATGQGYDLIKHLGYEREDEFRALLDGSPGLLNTLHKGNTLLHYAAANGLPDTVEYLVTEKGMAVDTLDHTGQTPLTWACKEDYGAETVAKLLELGANPNAQSESGLTPLLASSPSVPEIYNALLAANASPNARDDEGKTIMHWLAYYKVSQVADMIAALKNHGADLTILDNDGKTPADLAETDEMRNLLTP